MVEVEGGLFALGYAGDDFAWDNEKPQHTVFLQDFAIDLVMATQPGTERAHELSNKYIRYGSSPRGAQALVECGRVLALMKGRFHLSVEDIEAVAAAVLRHRIILNFDAHAEGQNPETILAQIIPSVGAAVH